MAIPEKQSRAKPICHAKRGGGELWVTYCSHVANKPSGKPSREEMGAGRVGVRFRNITKEQVD